MDVHTSKDKKRAKIRYCTPCCTPVCNLQAKNISVSENGRNRILYTLFYYSVQSITQSNHKKRQYLLVFFSYDCALFLVPKMGRNKILYTILCSYKQSITQIYPMKIGTITTYFFKMDAHFSKDKTSK